MSEWRAAYPLIVLSGVLLAAWALRNRSSKSKLDETQRTAVGLAAFTGAMIGAKVPFWIVQASDSAPFAWFADGKTILGGIFGGYLAVELTKWTLGVKARTGDQFAVPVAIAVATGRLGCFVAGCCYGAVTNVPWAVVFPLVGPEPRHPTQLYEFAFHATMVAVLLLIERAQLLSGRRLTLYLMSYLAYRFVTEWIRPEPAVALGMTAYQLTCTALAALLTGNEFLQQQLSESPGNASDAGIDSRQTESDQ